MGEGLALRSGELVVLVLREGHADDRPKQANGEHESVEGGAPQRRGERIDRAADTPHACVVKARVGESEGIVGDLLPDSGPQGRVQVSAPQQCVRLLFGRRAVSSSVALRASRA